MSNPHSVRVGQAWKSCDKRETRVVVVTEVGETHALVRSRLGTQTSKIRLDRFRPNSTGWRLIEDVPHD